MGHSTARWVSGLAIAAIFILGLAFVASYDQQQSEISSLGSQVQGLRTSLSTAQGVSGELQAELTRLENAFGFQSSQAVAANETALLGVGLHESWEVSGMFAGYINVTILASGSPTTYVRVSWNATGFGVEYNDTRVLKGGGTALFPLLPSLDTSSTAHCLNAYCITSTVATVTIINGAPYSTQPSVYITYVY